MIITPDNSGKQDIILDNLQNNNGEIISKLKKRRLHLRELALSLTDTLDSEDRDDGLYSPEELTERFNMYKEYTESSSNDEEQNGFAERGLDLISTLSEAFICRDLAANTRIDRLLTPKKPEGSRICYFRNAFSDLAFLRFTTLLPDASADYTHDFASACEEVYNGRYDYCILPVSSHSDGQLTRFIALMQKYELSIALSCSVPTNDDGFMSFYLLSGDRVCLENADTLAMCIIPGKDYPIWKFLCSAQLLGARCKECTSLPIRMYSEQAFFAEFDISHADTDALSVYMELSPPECIIAGVYRHIP